MDAIVKASEIYNGDDELTDKARYHIEKLKKDLKAILVDKPEVKAKPPTPILQNKSPVQHATTTPLSFISVNSEKGTMPVGTKVTFGRASKGDNSNVDVIKDLDNCYSIIMDFKPSDM